MHDTGELAAFVRRPRFEAAQLAAGGERQLAAADQHDVVRGDPEAPKDLMAQRARRAGGIAEGGRDRLGDQINPSVPRAAS